MKKNFIYWHENQQFLCKFVAIKNTLGIGRLCENNNWKKKLNQILNINMGFFNYIIPEKSDKDFDQSASTKANGMQENVEVKPKYESLRSLVRFALMQDEISEKTVETLKKKAVSLGMDADELEIFFNGLVAKKKKANKKMLIEKGNIGNDKYFEGNDFDNDFDLAFLTEDERLVKKSKAKERKKWKLGNIIGIVKSIGKIVFCCLYACTIFVIEMAKSIGKLIFSCLNPFVIFVVEMAKSIGKLCTGVFAMYKGAEIQLGETKQSLDSTSCSTKNNFDCKVSHPKHKNKDDEYEEDDENDGMLEGGKLQSL